MWWKIYFWINVIILSLGSFGIFVSPRKDLIIAITYIVAYIISLFGLYSYINRKKILSVRFWEVFFWSNILLDVLYYISVFFPSITFLSFLSLSPDPSILSTIVDAIIEVPILYALYQLSKGRFLERKEKLKQEKKDDVIESWGLVQIAMWGYSTVLLLFTLLLALLPSSNHHSSNDLGGVLVFAPLVLFFAMVLYKRKQYSWNWWKSSLVATSSIYSSMIVIGMGLPSSSPSSEEANLVGLLPFLVIFITLVILGRERLGGQNL